jgi:hypothetical protein
LPEAGAVGSPDDGTFRAPEQHAGFVQKPGNLVQSLLSSSPYLCNQRPDDLRADDELAKRRLVAV